MPAVLTPLTTVCPVEGPITTRVRAEVGGGDLAVFVSHEEAESAHRFGILYAALTALAGEETVVESRGIDGPVWLYHDDEGHGFEGVEEALQWLGAQDAWSGWRRRAAEEEAE